MPIQIKKELKNLIDHIDDSDQLEEVYRLLSMQQSGDKDILSGLSDLQKSRVHRSLEEYKDGLITDHETVMENTRKWREK
jgi:translation initiation factor RLI1